MIQKHGEPPSDALNSFTDSWELMSRVRSQRFTSVEPELQGSRLDLLALDEALQRLAIHDPWACDVVKLRFFAGLTVPQAAKSLGVSVATAENDWAYAKSWLKLQLSAIAEEPS